MPPFTVTPSPFPIRVGQTIGGLAWSNVAYALTGRFKVLYEDGTYDALRIDDTSIPSTRAATTFVCRQTAEKNGFIVGGWLGFHGTGPTQRGQSYVQAAVSPVDDLQESTDLLCAGYNYFGHPVELGTYVEPGPVSGAGQMKLITGVNQAAGTLPFDAVPAGAIWRVRSYEAVLVTDANAGNRSFALVYQDSSGTVNRTFVASNANVQAATLTRKWAWFSGTDLSTTVGATFTDTDIVLPAYNLKTDILLGPADALRLVSTGTLAFTATDDFAAPLILVEEWVMPN